MSNTMSGIFNTIAITWSSLYNHISLKKNFGPTVRSHCVHARFYQSCDWWNSMKHIYIYILQRQWSTMQVVVLFWISKSTLICLYKLQSACNLFKKRLLLDVSCVYFFSYLLFDFIYFMDCKIIAKLYGGNLLLDCS